MQNLTQKIFFYQHDNTKIQQFKEKNIDILKQHWYSFLFYYIIFLG